MKIMEGRVTNHLVTHHLTSVVLYHAMPAAIVRPAAVMKGFCAIGTSGVYSPPYVCSRDFSRFSPLYPPPPAPRLDHLSL